MKRNFRLFCTMCLAGTLAFFASSCKKNEEKQTVRVMLPEFEEAAALPGEEDRAYINFNDGKFYWNANDKVMLYNVDNTGETTVKAVYATDESAEGQQLTGFFHYSGPQIGEKKDHYFVFYPVQRVGDGSNELASLGTQNRETFNVPAVQHYSYDVNHNPTVDPNSMALATEIWRLNQDFKLQHIFGVCRLRLKGTGKVTSIDIMDNYLNLVGTVQLKLHKVQMNTLDDYAQNYKVDDVQNTNSAYYIQLYSYLHEMGYAPVPAANGNVVTLDCTTADGGGVQLNTSTYELFYISLRPGAFVDGFKFVVHYTQGGKNYQQLITNYESPVANGHKDLYTIKPGMITTFKVQTSIEPENGVIEE